MSLRHILSAMFPSFGASANRPAVRFGIDPTMTLSCDASDDNGCTNKITVRSETIDDGFANARKNGWYIEHGKVQLCPECAAEWLQKAGRQ